MDHTPELHSPTAFLCASPAAEKLVGRTASANRVARSFGVRQLAAAFLPASLLTGKPSERTIPRQQAGWGQSGSKLPHSKASHRMPAVKRFSVARFHKSGRALRQFPECVPAQSEIAVTDAAESCRRNRAPPSFSARRPLLRGGMTNRSPLSVCVGR